MYYSILRLAPLWTDGRTGEQLITDRHLIRTSHRKVPHSTTHLDSNKPHRTVWCSWIHSQNWANLLDHSNKPSGFLQFSHGRHIGSFIFFYQTCFNTLPSVLHSCKFDIAYTSVSQPLWDRSPVNSFFIRRGPGPNKFTRKYLSIFFKFIH